MRELNVNEIKDVNGGSIDGGGGPIVRTIFNPKTGLFEIEQTWINFNLIP